MDSGKKNVNSTRKMRYVMDLILDNHSLIFIR